MVYVTKRRGGAVGIETGYGLHDRGVGVRVPVGLRISISSFLQTGSRATQPPIQWVQGALTQVVKRAGREADHSPPTSAEIKKT
jgi:hypothetical protein